MMIKNIAQGVIVACMLVWVASACSPRPARVASTGVSTRVSSAKVPSKIMGDGRLNTTQLTKYLMGVNREADRAKVERLVRFYISEAGYEGVNHDVAFAQMCLETGNLKFGNLVVADMNNFAGLGSMGDGHKGASFPDEQTGVRAHIQHLKAYASTTPPLRPLVDPRYKYVNPKGKAPNIDDLSGTWATDMKYGTKIKQILAQMYNQL